MTVSLFIQNIILPCGYKDGIAYVFESRDNENLYNMLYNRCVGYIPPLLKHLSQLCHGQLFRGCKSLSYLIGFIVQTPEMCNWDFFYLFISDQCMMISLFKAVISCIHHLARLWWFFLSSCSLKEWYNFNT